MKRTTVFCIIFGVSLVLPWRVEAGQQPSAQKQTKGRTSAGKAKPQPSASSQTESDVNPKPGSSAKSAHKPQSLGPLPSIPQVLPDLQWSEKIRNKLERALKIYPEDQPLAYLVFSEMLESRDKDERGTTFGQLIFPEISEFKDAVKDEKPTSEEQRTWLENIRTTIRPRALAVLERDYQATTSSEDLRKVLIAAEVLSKVKGGGSKESQTDILNRYPELSKLAQRSFQGRTKSKPVWEITQAKAERIGYIYTERYGFQTGAAFF